MSELDEAIWIRSYPVVAPPHRPRVLDELPRFYQMDYDYAALGAYDRDIFLIEWDIACPQDEMDWFVTNALRHPHEVRVAAHRLYHIQSDPVWAHRVVSAQGQERWAWWQEPVCDYFAFGMIYLPRDLIRQFLAAPAPERGRSPFVPEGNPYEDCRFIDQTFSVWHKHRLGRRVEIDWSVRPVHLHAGRRVS